MTVVAGPEPAARVHRLPLSQRPTADPWRRLAARLIDFATVLTALWILVVVHVLWFMDDLSRRFDPDPWGRGYVATCAFVVLLAGYEIVFLVRSKGQTPGKDIMKVRVIALQGGGLSTSRAVRRWAVSGLLPLIPALWLAAAAVAATGLPAAWFGRRSLQDLVAGTRVVPYDRDREDPSARRPKSRRVRSRERDAEAPQDDTSPTPTRSPR